MKDITAEIIHNAQVLSALSQFFVPGSKPSKELVSAGNALDARIKGLVEKMSVEHADLEIEEAQEIIAGINAAEAWVGPLAHA